MIPFEDDNLRAYSLLLRIEIAIRELLKSSMKSEFGEEWRKRIPGDLLTKIKVAQTEENRPQFDYKRLGPLYYLTFGELLTLLTQKPGKQAAEKLGGDNVLKQLENILVPRNAVCHSRPVSSVGLKTIQTLFAELEAALTRDGFEILTSKPDAGLDQGSACCSMIPAFACVILELPDLPASFVEPEDFETAKVQFWWANDSLAGFNRTAIEDAVSIIREYNALPKGVGCAGDRQRFIDESDVMKRVQHAISELQGVKT
ncbi:MAG TPA: hypothetical protein VK147_13040 [Candidatus Didemnitutus sp.]|nr:hypothetical protein [Candidatus Didemnitutus sp.]